MITKLLEGSHKYYKLNINKNQSINQNGTAYNKTIIKTQFTDETKDKDKSFQTENRSSVVCLANSN